MSTPQYDYKNRLCGTKPETYVLHLVGVTLRAYQHMELNDKLVFVVLYLGEFLLVVEALA